MKKTKIMKIKIFLFICSFCILSTAYSQYVLSLYPLFTEQDALLVPQIEGDWSIPDFGMMISFQKAGDNFYLLKYGSETNLSIFEAVFVKINNELFLDLNGSLPDTLGDDEYRSIFITGHSLYKIPVSYTHLTLPT